MAGRGGRQQERGRTLGGRLAEAYRAYEGGRLDEAERLCAAELRRRPRDLDAWQIRGMVATARGRLEEAERHHRTALGIDRRSVLHRCGLGKVLTLDGRYDDALAEYERALAIDAGSVHAATGKAGVLERLGRFDEAEATIAPFVAGDRPELAAVHPAATLRQRRGDHEGAAAILRAALDQPGLPPMARRSFLFLLGASLEKLAAHDAAFDAYDEANRLFARPFDVVALRRQYGRLRDVWSADAAPSLPRSTRDSDLPVFVVSMPRCGSTLIEQILAAHPSVHGAGEILEIGRRRRELEAEAGAGTAGYPELMRDLPVAALDAAADRHLETLRALGPGASRVVDKNLQNFAALGLVAQLLPGARAIWCRRHPLATCWSCWTLPLTPDTLPYTTDLRSLGEFHVEYERLMAHWFDVLGIELLEVRYEDLVADQEAVSRSVVAFAGLEWDDTCLRFHESGREVSTASYDQVRRPMYRDALARFRPYAHRLGPLVAALGDTLEDAP